MFNKEIYIPRKAIIKEIHREAKDTNTYRIEFPEKIPGHAEGNAFNPGQFILVSILGVGEAPISLTSSPTEKGFLEICVRDAGSVTGALHKLKVGDEIGVRGPYGNSFPVEELKGSNLLFVAGGIGLAPLRSVIKYVLSHRGEYGKVYILYGARSPEEMVFQDEFSSWNQVPDTEVLLTVDTETPGWKGPVGVVTNLLKTLQGVGDFKALICGPPVMVPFVIMGLRELELKEENIITTLERYMKCGVGKCGHCYISGKYTCVDGPVFTYAQMKELAVEEAVVA